MQLPLQITFRQPSPSAHDLRISTTPEDSLNESDFATCNRHGDHRDFVGSLDNAVLMRIVDTQAARAKVLEALTQGNRSRSDWHRTRTRASRRRRPTL